LEQNLKEMAVTLLKPWRMFCKLRIHTNLTNLIN